MMQAVEILKNLPYEKPFLFVDEINEVNEEGITGQYRFREDEHFYSGHFVGNPVTPGVILTECMAQIGLVSLGIFLLGKVDKDKLQIAFSSSQVDFFKAVKPGEKVKVMAEKKYWRLGKLKCKTKMYNEQEELLCSGELSGMIKQKA